MAKLSAVGIGVLAIALALAGGAGFNISVLVGMAFCFASSVNFPALLLALWWPRFNTMGAVVGMSSGLIASTTLIVLSAPVWPGADSDTGSPLGDYGLDNPAIFSHPDRVPGLLPGHGAVEGEGQRPRVPRALGALGDRARGRGLGAARRCAASRGSPRAAPEPVGLVAGRRRAHAGAHPDPHRQPRGRGEGRVAAGGAARGGRPRGDLARARARADEPDRADAQPRRAARAVPDRAPRHGAAGQAPTGRATRSRPRSTAAACTGAGRAT